MIQRKVLKIEKCLHDDCPELSFDNKDGWFLDLNHKSDIYYYSCREEFFALFYNNKRSLIGFFLQTKKRTLNIKLVDEFFDTIENSMGIPAKKRTVFYYTDAPNAIALKLSEVWLRSIVMFDLMSLLLRCAALYYDGNIDKALKSYDLSKKIYPLIKWIVGGNYCSPFDVNNQDADNVLEVIGIDSAYISDDYYGIVDFFCRYCTDKKFKYLKFWFRPAEFTI